MITDICVDTSIGVEDRSNSAISVSSPGHGEPQSPFRILDDVSAGPSLDRLKGAYQRAVVAVEGSDWSASALAGWESENPEHQQAFFCGRESPRDNWRRDAKSTEAAAHQEIHKHAPNGLGMPPTQWGFVQDQLGAFARELARLRQHLEEIDKQQTDATRQVSVTQAEVAKESMSLLYQLTTEQKRSKEAVEREQGIRQESMEQLDARLKETFGALRADLEAEGLARKEVSGQVAKLYRAHEQEVVELSTAAARLHQTLEAEVVHRQALEQEVQGVRSQVTALQKDLEQEVIDRGAADTEIMASMKNSLEQVEKFQDEHAVAINQLQADAASLREAVGEQVQSRSVQEEETIRCIQKLREEDAELREAVMALRGSIDQEVVDRGVGDGELDVRMTQTNETLTMLTSIFDRLKDSVTSEIQLEVDQRMQAFGAMAADLARVEQRTSSDKEATEKRHYALQMSLEELDVKLSRELTREVNAVKLRQHTELEDLREQFTGHGKSLMDYKALAREDRAICAAQGEELAEVKQRLRDVLSDVSKVAAQVAEWSDMRRQHHDDYRQVSLGNETDNRGWLQASRELEQKLEGVRREQPMHNETSAPETMDAQIQSRLGDLSLAISSHSEDGRGLQDLFTERDSKFRPEAHGEGFRHMSPRSHRVHPTHGEWSSTTTIERSSVSTLLGPTATPLRSSLTLDPASARRVMEVLSESPRDQRSRSGSRGVSATPDVTRKASAPPPRLSTASLVVPAASKRRPSWDPGLERQRGVAGTCASSSGGSGRVPAVQLLPSSLALTPPMPATGMPLSSAAPSATVLHHPSTCLQRAASGGRRQASPPRRLALQAVLGHPSVAVQAVQPGTGQCRQ